jgi:hypothetical protein
MVVELTVDTRSETKWAAIMDISAQQKLGPMKAAAAVLLGLALTVAFSPAAAQQWTPQKRVAWPLGLRR